VILFAVTDEVWSNDAQGRVITSYMQKFHVPPLVLSMYFCIASEMILTNYSIKVQNLADDLIALMASNV
jgi:hypothetical protein